MKKLLIPTAFAVLLTTGLVAGDASKEEAMMMESTATEPVAEPAPAPTAKVVSPKAPAKKPAVHRRRAHHHSNVDVKLANELTAKLNAMTCPFATAAAPAA